MSNTTAAAPVAHRVMEIDEVRVGDVLVSAGTVTDVSRRAGVYTVTGDLDTITGRRGSTVIALDLSAERGPDYWTGLRRP